MMSKASILVAAAAIVDAQNRVLITRRPANVHQGGKWEFPGGKCEPGESVRDALDRELMEELGVKPNLPEHLITLTHVYPEKTVTLSVWIVRSYSGVLHGRENQPLLWQSISDLEPEQFPAADYGIIRALQLPEFCVITPDLQNGTETRYLNRLEQVLTGGIRLLILRNHKLDRATYGRLAKATTDVCKRFDARCMLNMPVDWLADIGEANLHLSSSRLMQCEQRPRVGKSFLSASCHSLKEIRQAGKIGVDFILLSPVCVTASHPGSRILGWDKFAELVQHCSVPVYALGGLGRKDLHKACSCGAQGVAGITDFWDVKD